MQRFWRASIVTLWGLAFAPLGQAQESLATLVSVQDSYWEIVKVIDGDTIKVRAPNLPAELSNLAIRVRGVDAPERGGKARCPWEFDHAEQASLFTERFLHRGPIRLARMQWDKYGGRVLADIYVENRSLAEGLIEAGLARSYDGGKRTGWCE